jgi:hypothetical protein
VVGFAMAAMPYTNVKTALGESRFDSALCNMKFD